MLRCGRANMSSVNLYTKEISLKIVYYGPGLGGKTSSLQYIHRAIKPDARGQLVSLSTGVDRTLYFDFLPVKLPKLRGYTVRVQLYTVPGQVHYNSTRKLVLTGADGIVFVADSQKPRREANIESFGNLRRQPARAGAVARAHAAPPAIQQARHARFAVGAGARRRAQSASRAHVRDLGDQGRRRVRGAQVDHDARALGFAAARRLARRRQGADGRGGGVAGVVASVGRRRAGVDRSVDRGRGHPAVGAA